MRSSGGVTKPTGLLFMATPIVTLTTDFGLDDSYLAEVKAVLLSGAKSVQLVDVTHAIEPYQIQAGAFHLYRCYRYFPKGTIHIAVVDPGVGTSRKCLYVEVGGHHFIGPDNGLLLWAVRDCEHRSGEEASAFEIPVSEQITPTFHGRDVFAPFAVKILRGKVPRKMDSVTQLKGEEFPGSRELEGRKRGEILAWDRFGNVITSVPVAPNEKAEAQIGDREDRYLFCPNYESISEGKVGLIRGSHGLWELASNQASAKELLQVKIGDEVTLFPFP